MSLQYEPAPNMLAKRGWAYLLEAAKLARIRQNLPYVASAFLPGGELGKRLNAVGGLLQVISLPGDGTRIRLQVPLEG